MQLNGVVLLVEGQRLTDAQSIEGTMSSIEFSCSELRRSTIGGQVESVTLDNWYAFLLIVFLLWKKMYNATAIKEKNTITATTPPIRAVDTVLMAEDDLIKVGSFVGIVEGKVEGAVVGLNEGCDVGPPEGAFDGVEVGEAEVWREGETDGSDVDGNVGSFVGNVGEMEYDGLIEIADDGMFGGL